MHNVIAKVKREPEGHCYGARARGAGKGASAYFVRTWQPALRALSFPAKNPASISIQAASATLRLVCKISSGWSALAARRA